MQVGDEEFESICSRCGLCCHHRTLGEPCPYLKYEPLPTDPHQKLRAKCTVYDHRFQVVWHDSQGGSHRCFSIKEALDRDTLPRGCPYRILKEFNSL